MIEVTCSKCGASRPPELASKHEHPPCPHCAATALTISVSIEESITISDHCTADLIPGNQARDWKQRWRLIQDDLQVVSSPHTEVMSGKSIHTSLQSLFSFFIHTYHLKDALREAAPELGLEPSDIENAITNDPRLALLADLANVDKHMKLTKSPRSGCVPVIEQISGTDNSTGHGWRLVAKIKHGKSMLDGLSVAYDAVKAWREKLETWGLV